MPVTEISLLVAPRMLTKTLASESKRPEHKDERRESGLVTRREMGGESAQKVVTQPAVILLIN
jgi:hypothetical protein